MSIKLVSLVIGSMLLVGLVAGCGTSTSKDIKIGVVYELTGSTASFGTAAANGAKPRL